MIITISGTAGSGKSTVAKLLAQKLNYKHYSTGDFMRDMAKNRGVSLEELGDEAKTNPQIDKDLDARQIKLGREEDNFVIDGRLSFHFIKNSIKIFIDADVEARAKRIMKDLREEENAVDVEEMSEKIRKRQDVEIIRYQKYYGLNPYDKTNYDVLIDSTDITAEQVAEKILEFIEKRNS